MGLITLDQAKAHLHVTDDDSNGDIQIKAEQASAIVLDYLKMGRTTAIASVSVANPTVVTTTLPHSLTSGETSTIAGTTTTPTINGARLITVTGPSTFTVPVAVTVGQSTAAGTVARPVWTESTVPGPVQSAVLLMLGHLYEHRGDELASDENLWLAISRLLMRLRDPALA